MSLLGRRVKRKVRFHPAEEKQWKRQELEGAKFVEVPGNIVSTGQLWQWVKEANPRIDSVLVDDDGWLAVNDIQDEDEPLPEEFNFHFRESLKASGVKDVELLRRAESLLESIVAVPDVNFDAAKVFTDLPWPALSAPVSRMDTMVDGKFWAVGRDKIKSVLERFLAHKIVTDFDGTRGAGKTHICVLIAIKCFKEFSVANATRAGERRKVLVCLFDIPSTVKLLFHQLRNAFLVAFVGVPLEQNHVLQCLCIEDLERVFFDQAWAMKYDMHFIFDQFNKLDRDQRQRDPELQQVYTHLINFEVDAHSLHGGTSYPDRISDVLAGSSSVNENAVPLRSVFSKKEISLYLEKCGLPLKIPQLKTYTGRLPMLVREYVKCYNARKSQVSSGPGSSSMQTTPADDDAIRNDFLSTQVMQQMKNDLKSWVAGLNKVSVAPQREAAIASFLKLVAGRADISDQDRDIGVSTRWTIGQPGKYGLVSSLASGIVLHALQTLVYDNQQAALARATAIQIIEEIGVTKPNPGLIGTLVEKLVIFVCKTSKRLPRCLSLNGSMTSTFYFTGKLFDWGGPGVTLFLPDNWRHPYVDFIVRHMDNGKYHVDFCQVSVGLQKGADHWKTASKTFEPENVALYCGGKGYDEIMWSYRWIGRDCDLPTPGKDGWSEDKSREGKEGDIKFIEYFHTLDEVICTDIDETVCSALKAVSALTRASNKK